MDRNPTYEELLERVKSLEIEVAKGKQTEDEKRELEIQLIQAQKMESIGTLAGGIAHDFNNILAPIIGYTEMMISEVPQESLVGKHLMSILSATNRAKDLVQQILTFSRQSRPEPKPLMIQPVIHEALKLLRSSLPTTIEIRQNIGEGFGQVKADPTQIHQMILNLGTNAYHAMRENGGILEITLKEIKVGTRNQALYPTLFPGSYLKLSVSDTGYGIDNMVIKKIFDPYFTTKKNGEGTGLGLSIVHGIVKAHNGHISVQSKIGEGTTFHIYLPRIVTAAAGAKDTKNIALPRGNEHVLLVDDEQSLLQMEKEMLENLGYRVTAKSSSMEALEKFKQNPDQYDVVITDMTMPRMTGDKLSQDLLEIKPNIPIILYTGFSETISRDKAISLGIKEFLMKPVAMNQIAVTLRHILDRQNMEIAISYQNVHSEVKSTINLF